MPCSDQRSGIWLPRGFYKPGGRGGYVPPRDVSDTMSFFSGLLLICAQRP